MYRNMRCSLSNVRMHLQNMPISVTGLPKATVCGRSLAGIPGSNSTEGIDVCLSVVYCQVAVSAKGRSLVQRSPTDYDMLFSEIQCTFTPLHLPRGR